MNTETKVTHATASVVFGRQDDDPHQINVTTYHGLDDMTGVEEAPVEVTDEDWESAYGKTTAEKIESVLGWSGAGQTEHDRDVCHIVFD